MSTFKVEPRSWKAFSATQLYSPNITWVITRQSYFHGSHVPITVLCAVAPVIRRQERKCSRVLHGLS